MRFFLPSLFQNSEKQNLEVFVDGVENIVQAQQKCAKVYFDDGTIENACPPLKVLLHIMAHGHYEGQSITDPKLRSMFTREALLNSEWYKNRLKLKQHRDVMLWEKHIDYLENVIECAEYKEEVKRLGLADKLANAYVHLEFVRSSEYLSELVGTIGADPISK